MKNWPRLSETLTGPKSPHECRKCGALNPECLIQECDEQDKPEGIHFWLCLTCEREIIKPHPRLYVRLDNNIPLPGLMDLCDNCLHRDGYKCSVTKANGGPGLNVTVGTPYTAHLYRAGGGSKWIKLYPDPPSHCSRRDVDVRE